MAALGGLTSWQEIDSDLPSYEQWLPKLEDLLP